MKKETFFLIASGLVIGIISSLLVLFGNPGNMGFCIACFVRDTTGALGFHSAEAVQYIRPELIGLVLGGAIVSRLCKEFAPKGGSAPLTRFVLGICIMIGALMFLGCPFRMLVRIAAGDMNALLGFVGFVLGVITGVYFLEKGFTLKRNYTLPMLEGNLFTIIQVVLLVLLVAAPTFIHFSQSGPGASHANWIISLVAGCVVGGLAYRSRLCMVGGVRNIFLSGEFSLFFACLAVVLGALFSNLILNAASVSDITFFKLGMEGQPIAHTSTLWNMLGLYLVAFGSVLAGACPLRNFVLSGSGNTDSVMLILGLGAGAAICHNFGLASSAAGPTTNGKIAVIIGIAVVLAIAILNTFFRKGKNA